jgi:hypothetical protein
VLEIEGRFVEIQDGDWSVPFRILSEADTKHKYIVGFGPESQVNIFTYVNGEKGSDLAYMRGLPVKGGFETNHLLIVAVGLQVALYVSGEPALFATDPNFDERYKSGPFELVVCNFADTPLEVRWDNLRIWDISDLPLP